MAMPATEASAAAAVRPVMAARVARALRAAKVAEAHSGVIEVDISAAAGGAAGLDMGKRRSSPSSP